MTKKKNPTTEVLPGDSLGDFFFWLGADAELFSVSRPEFEALVEKKHQENEDYLNLGRTRN